MLIKLRLSRYQDNVILNRLQIHYEYKYRTKCTQWNFAYDYVFLVWWPHSTRRSCLDRLLFRLGRLFRMNDVRDSKSSNLKSNVSPTTLLTNTMLENFVRGFPMWLKLSLDFVVVTELPNLVIVFVFVECKRWDEFGMRLGWDVGLECETSKK